MEPTVELKLMTLKSRPKLRSRLPKSLSLEDVKSHVMIAGYNVSLRLHMLEGVDDLITSNKHIPHF